MNGCLLPSSCLVIRYLFRMALKAFPRSRYTHLAWALWEKRQGNLDLCLRLLQQVTDTVTIALQAFGANKTVVLVNRNLATVERSMDE